MTRFAVCATLLSGALGCSASVESSLPYSVTVDRVRLMCSAFELKAEGEATSESAKNRKTPYPILGVREAPLYPGAQMAFTFTEPVANNMKTRIHLRERGGTTLATVTCTRDTGEKTVRDPKRAYLWSRVVGHYVTNDPPGGPGLSDIIIKLIKAKPR